MSAAAPRTSAGSRIEATRSGTWGTANDSSSQARIRRDRHAGVMIERGIDELDLSLRDGFDDIARAQRLAYLGRRLLIAVCQIDQHRSFGCPHGAEEAMRHRWGRRRERRPDEGLHY